jgi:hypothetical protein
MIARVPPGEHRCVARTRGGAEAEAKFTVPGGTIDLVVDAPSSKRRSANKR